MLTHKFGIPKFDEKRYTHYDTCEICGHKDYWIKEKSNEKNN